MKQIVVELKLWVPGLHSVLFGFSPNPAAYFARSSSNHSYGYAFSDDRTNCFAGLTENSEHS